jgi:hypothetical protein
VQHARGDVARSKIGRRGARSVGGGTWHHAPTTAGQWWTIGVGVPAMFLCSLIGHRVMRRSLPLSPRAERACERAGVLGGGGAGMFVLDPRTGVVAVGAWLVVVAIVWLTRRRSRPRRRSRWRNTSTAAGERRQGSNPRARTRVEGRRCGVRSSPRPVAAPGVTGRTCLDCLGVMHSGGPLPFGVSCGPGIRCSARSNVGRSVGALVGLHDWLPSSSLGCEPGPGHPTE